MRGPGELIGARQHGEDGLSAAMFASNMKAFNMAKDAADKLIAKGDMNDPLIKKPSLRRMKNEKYSAELKQNITVNLYPHFSYLPFIISPLWAKHKARQSKEVKAMSRNSVLIPEAKKAMDSFKSEVANSLNVNLKQGDNGDLTSRQAGSIGGEMVKRMIAYAANNMNK